MQTVRAMGAGLALALCLVSGPPSAKAEVDVMKTSVSTTAPIGHRLLCRDLPEECKPGRGHAVAPVDLVSDLILKVAEINTRTNAEITPASDEALYGVEEHWAYPAGQGDCEDFVLLKRRRLHDIGISLSNLLITVVRKQDGEGHAVLTLRTSSGDFVLDNLDWRVRAWRDTPYVYVKRQSTEDPSRWMSIAGHADVAVSALGR